MQENIGINCMEYVNWFDLTQGRNKDASSVNDGDEIGFHNNSNFLIGLIGRKSLWG
jgi:hypothetical protein